MVLGAVNQKSVDGIRSNNLQIADLMFYELSSVGAYVQPIH